MLNAIKVDEDYAHLVQLCFIRADGYAQLQRDSKPVLLHHLVLPKVKGMHVDHINGEKLDNRRENLRLVTPSQNCANSKIPKNNTSGYKGVSKNGTYGWKGKIRTPFGYFYLGTYKTKEEAALAYNKAALFHFGEFAKLNEID